MLRGPAGSGSGAFTLFRGIHFAEYARLALPRRIAFGRFLGYRGSCPIHEQLLTGLVLLPEHHILFPPPPLI